jgi:hypothetical protein
MKKQKKALPPGLSEEDQEILVKVKRRAYRLDMALGTCCGFKIGKPYPVLLNSPYITSIFPVGMEGGIV